MKKTITLALVFMATIHIALAQEKGIHFEKSPQDFNEIVKKAKAENKYIFVDCYATWCGPCKAMEQNIYPLKEVGDVFNKAFVSIKLQMDKTPHDNPNTKNWYDTADDFGKDYTVNAYPTFLFFSPDGKIVHKVVGAFENGTDFIKIAQDAHNPAKQYYTIVKNFQPGKMDTAELKSLAVLFSYQDKELAGRMAADYLHRIPLKNLEFKDNGSLMVQFKDDPQVLAIAANFIKTHDKIANIRFINVFKEKEQVRDIIENYLSSLPKGELGNNDNLTLMRVFSADLKIQKIANAYIDQLSERELYNSDVLGFLTSFTKMPEDKGFAVFYDHADRVDAIWSSKGASMSVAQDIIENKESIPLLKIAKEKEEQPDFDHLTAVIEKKYNPDMAKRIVVDAKLDWYKFLVYNKNKSQFWPEMITSRITKVEINHADTIKANSNSINTIAYEEMFKHCDNTEQLNIVAKWMRNVVDRKPKGMNEIDTYACILYKAGRLPEALEWEGKAALGAPKNAGIQANLEKMKKGEKFWLDK